MGFFSQNANRKKTAPIIAQVGPWLARARAELPALTESQLMFLAGLHTTLAARAKLSGTRSSTLGEGTQSSVVKFMSARDSILRFEGFGSYGQLTLGTPGNVLDWKTDWSLRYTIGAPSSEITVPTYRTWNDEIANYTQLNAVRALLAEAIAQGPEWVVTPGYPRAADHLTAVRQDRLASPFSHDYCDSPDGATLLPVRVACPDRMVTWAAEKIGYPTRTDPATTETLIHIAPDGDLQHGVVRLRAAGGDHSVLVFPQVAGLSPIEGQRVRRRSLRLMRALVVELEASYPEVASMNGVIAAIESASADTATWVDAWTEQIHTPQWAVKPGALIPVAVVSAGHVEGSVLDRMIAGASSVALRRRTFTRGLTSKSREDGRALIARNAAILAAADGSYQPFLRYVSTPDASEASIPLVRSDLPMFWEVFHGNPVGGPATTTLLLTTGLGITEGNVVYGNELMAHMEALCSFASQDQGRTCQTISLRVPYPA